MVCRPVRPPTCTPPPWPPAPRFKSIGDLEYRAEPLVRALARLGAAARGNRPRHHLRRHGRHQHGARRDGDDRRLRHLRGAGADPHQKSGAVRLFAGDRAAARLHRLRRRRHPDRAHGDPLPLRPAAGDAARHLGPVADPATGGALDVRADQQGSRQSGLDERRLRPRRHPHHLQPAVDHRASRRSCSWRCSACCASRGSASRCAP